MVAMTKTIADKIDKNPKELLPNVMSQFHQINTLRIKLDNLDKKLEIKED